MGRSTKLKNVGGKLVSAKSKTGDPGCALAASLLSLGTNTPASNKKLGECRSKARKLSGAGKQRMAGNEAKAQHMEHIANSGAPVTLKDRLAKANAMRAGRTAAAKPGYGHPDNPSTQAAHRVAAARAAKGGTYSRPEREPLRPERDHGPLSPSGKVSRRAAKAFSKREDARIHREHLEMDGPLTRHPTSPQFRAVPAFHRAKELRDLAARGMKPRAYKKAGDAEFAKGQAIIGRGTTDRNAKATALRSARKATAKPAAVVAKPSLRDQADKHRASKGDTSTRANALVARARDRGLAHVGKDNEVYNSHAKPAVRKAALQEHKAKAVHSFARANRLQSAQSKGSPLSLHERVAAHRSAKEQATGSAPELQRKSRADGLAGRAGQASKSARAAELQAGKAGNTGKAEASHNRYLETHKRSERLAVASGRLKWKADSPMGSGKTIDITPTRGLPTPAKPSLREIADKHRAGKGQFRSEATKASFQIRVGNVSTYKTKSGSVTTSSPRLGKLEGEIRHVRAVLKDQQKRGVNPMHIESGKKVLASAEARKRAILTNAIRKQARSSY